MGQKLDPMKEVLGTLGANGGLHCFINGLLNPGKELVTFEPMFPMYLDHIDLAGGRLRSVPLNIKDNKWTFNPDDLYNAFSQPDASVFLFNSPHNPTGKVFTKQEMELISDMLDDFPHIKVISDEVYSFLPFDGAEHHYFATIGNNWERTVSLFSGGKLFNCTGWKVGWAIGPQPLIHLGAIVTSAVYYCFNHPGQVGVANSLDKAFSKDFKEVNGKSVSYSEDVKNLFESNRNYLDKALREMPLPFKPLHCEGGYFLIADISECRHLIPERYLKTHDYQLPEHGPKTNSYPLNMPDGRIPLDLAFCRWMACENGVVMMPNSFFYKPGSPHTTENYVRMAICKERPGIETAIERLKLVKNNH